MSEKTIKAVARAIAAVEGYDLDGLEAYVASSSVAKKDYETLQRKARAAIEAYEAAKMAETNQPYVLWVKDGVTTWSDGLCSQEPKP